MDDEKYSFRIYNPYTKQVEIHSRDLIEIDIEATYLWGEQQRVYFEQVKRDFITEEWQLRNSRYTL